MKPWWACSLALALAAPLAAALPRPEGLGAEPAGAGARIRWQAVEGAGLYRVAVFDEPEADGKRPLLAAVWVRGTSWDYGAPAAVERAGGLPSTRPLPLPRGRTLRVMVSAARADGTDRSEWAGEDLRLEAAAPTPRPTATVSPTPTPGHGDEAELELEAGDEFSSSPDPVVIEVEEEPTPMPAAVEDEEARLRRLTKEQPANADHWEALGDALMAKRMKAEAHEAYSQALLLDGKRAHLREWIRRNAPRR